jgi:hypothetical protein
MNNTLHTPSPWKHDPTWGLIKHGKTEICALHSGNLANAHLISASPELLAICEEIANDSKCDLVYSERRIRLYSAIAKAKGE